MYNSSVTHQFRQYLYPGSQESLAPSPADVQSRGRRLKRLLRCVDGEILDQGQGEAFLVVRNRFPLQHAHGQQPLGETLEARPESLALLGRDERLAAVDLGQGLFFDVETTGLAGGTGTLAFLVGVGRYADGEFEVLQFFLAGPEHEAAFLQALSQALNPQPFLVSYNGRCFDAPLLDTRFILQRRRLNMSAWPHLDLLYPARRLYRSRTGDCSLKSIEAQVLGVRRSEEDVPGALIPGIYFDYLRGGPVEQLRSVFYHNLLDILSLATLAGTMASTIERRRAPDPRDYIGAGAMLEAAGRAEEAREAYERALAEGTHEAYYTATVRLGYLLKRQGDYARAKQLWRALVEAGVDPHAIAHVELAKHLEHRERDHEAAADVVRQALRLPGVRSALERRALELRLARLEDKCARAARKSGNDDGAHSRDAPL